ncbi:MAG: iron-sulfur cluster assembly accessory protein [Bdellovibrionaceae bacterium]|nr:iron-sulfur cluster assembly accessory protein [Pseudobdellovibrionaceae bacterium]
MITISENAASRLAALKKEEGQMDSACLRVEVKKGGCSGLSYKMNFDNQSREGDKTFETNGQKVVVDPQSLLYVLGLTLEYSGGLNGKGFVFNNPNAVKKCGCGTSFNI